MKEIIKLVTAHKTEASDELMELFSKEEWFWSKGGAKETNERTKENLRLKMLEQLHLFLHSNGWACHGSATRGKGKLADGVPKLGGIQVPRFKRKSYEYKIKRAFQATKRLGQETAYSSLDENLLNKIFATRTCDDPLALIQAVYPRLKPAVQLIREEKFKQLEAQPRDVHRNIYAFLNCYINWVKYNLDQFVIAPYAQIHRAGYAEHGYDLRCSKCFKCQTFRSANRKGNPKNVEVMFSTDTLRFISFCCNSTMEVVPLSTVKTTYVIYTNLKQMYGRCIHCGKIVFLETLCSLESAINCGRHGQ